MTDYTWPYDENGDYVVTTRKSHEILLLLCLFEAVLDCGQPAQWQTLGLCETDLRRLQFEHNNSDTNVVHLFKSRIVCNNSSLT